MYIKYNSTHTTGQLIRRRYPMHTKSTLQQYFFTPDEPFSEASVYVFWAGQRTCEPSHHVGPRVLEGYKMVFVTKGRGSLTIDGTSHSLEAGDMFALFPKERHEYRSDPDDPWEIMWVAISGRISPDLMGELGLTGTDFIRKNILNPSIKKTLTTLIHALGDREDTSRLAATGQLYVLLAYLKQAAGLIENTPETASSISCVEQAARFIEQNYYIDLDVQTLCDYVSYSRSYLSRVFHQETGYTIPEYINKIRMENAMELLRETTLPLREIAASVGIHDSFYFSKLFKKYTGRTPREFRLAHRS